MLVIDLLTELNLNCSKPQQYKLAKYCEDVLGEFLLNRPLDNVPVSRIPTEPIIDIVPVNRIPTEQIIDNVLVNRIPTEQTPR